MTITGNFERFQYFNSETNFLKVFLVESTKIKNSTFSYKTALSEANVKASRMGVQNWLITKNRGLPVTTLFFWQFCFTFRTSYKELIWCTNYSNVHILTFHKRGLFLKSTFFLWVSSRFFRFCLCWSVLSLLQLYVSVSNQNFTGIIDEGAWEENNTRSYCLGTHLWFPTFNVKFLLIVWETPIPNKTYSKVSQGRIKQPW